MVVFTLFFGGSRTCRPGGVPYPVFAMLAWCRGPSSRRCSRSAASLVLGNRASITKVYFPLPDPPARMRPRRPSSTSLSRFVVLSRHHGLVTASRSSRRSSTLPVLPADARDDGHRARLVPRGRSTSATATSPTPCRSWFSSGCSPPASSTPLPRCPRSTSPSRRSTLRWAPITGFRWAARGRAAHGDLLVLGVVHDRHRLFLGGLWFYRRTEPRFADIDMSTRIVAEGISQALPDRRVQSRRTRHCATRSRTRPGAALRLERIDHSARGRLWALKDVSFEIEEGEVVGIIGRTARGRSRS